MTKLETTIIQIITRAIFNISLIARPITVPRYLTVDEHPGSSACKTSPKLVYDEKLTYDYDNSWLYRKPNLFIYGRYA